MNTSIYCIGDSHVSFFGGADEIQPVWPERSQDNLPLFKTYHIGPALAYNLPRSETQTKGREKLFEILADEVPSGATVLLSFGEIDCRAHLVKRAETTGESLSAVVDVCIDEYFRVVNEVATLGFRVIVYNAIPSRPRARKKPSPWENSYPAHGTLNQRREAIFLFNMAAKQRCAKSRIAFMENANYLADGKSGIHGWYFFDSIHLSQRAMPATMQALADLFPDWSLAVPTLPSPTLAHRFHDWLLRRRKRIHKEIMKMCKRS